MIEVKAVSYEELRAEHFKSLMKKMQRKIDWWQAAGRSLNRSYNSRWHNECSEAGIQYCFYKDALEALENQPQWISPGEQMPEVNTSVLVALRDGHVFQALYNYDGWDLWEAFNGEIIAWMPLPEAPKEDLREQI